jgi:MYND finger protein
MASKLSSKDIQCIAALSDRFARAHPDVDRDDRMKFSRDLTRLLSKTMAAGAKDGFAASQAFVDKFNNDVRMSCAKCGEGNEILNDGSLRLKKCGRCLQIVYCSKRCQNRDWPEHKTVCKKK